MCNLGLRLQPLWSLEFKFAAVLKKTVPVFVLSFIPTCKHRVKGFSFFLALGRAEAEL